MLLCDAVAITAIVVLLPGCRPKEVEATRVDPTALPPPVASAASPRTAKTPDAPLAQKVQTALAGCKKPLSKGSFKTDAESSKPANIPICEQGDVVYWRADMDIDCDGIPSAVCNGKVDPDFQAQTAALASNGKFLDAAEVAYVVVPSPSARFDYEKAGLKLGSVVMVVRGESVHYAIIGDTGPAEIIGEASYKLAQRMGIDPDPRTGGAEETDILYVAFKGPASVVKRNEDGGEALALGRARATAVFP